jgi:hypothetical protein
MLRDCMGTILLLEPFSLFQLTSITVELIRSLIISISRSLRLPRKMATTAFCRQIANAKPKFPMTATEILLVERYTHAG